MKKALALFAFVGFLSYGAFGAVASATHNMQAHQSKVDQALEVATK